MASKLVVSERITTQAGTHEFRARQVFEGDQLVASYHGPLTPAETRKVDMLRKNLPQLEAHLAQFPLTDPRRSGIALSKGLTALHVEQLNQLVAYTKAVFIFTEVIRTYQATPPADRVSGTLTVDIYRQCANFLTLNAGLTLVQEDEPHWRKFRLNRHHLECVLDAAYEIAARLGKHEAAVSYLARAFQIKRSAPRAQGLVNLLTALGREDETTLYADYLADQALPQETP